MKRELEQVRELTKARIRSGNVPDWSWQHHVSLIEAIDSVLHDISMADEAHVERRRTGTDLRSVGGSGGNGRVPHDQRVVALPARARR